MLIRNFQLSSKTGSRVSSMVDLYLLCLSSFLVTFRFTVTYVSNLRPPIKNVTRGSIVPKYSMFLRFLAFIAFNLTTKFNASRPETLIVPRLRECFGAMHFTIAVSHFTDTSLSAPICTRKGLLLFQQVRMKHRKDLTLLTCCTCVCFDSCE